MRQVGRGFDSVKKLLIAFAATLVMALPASTSAATIAVKIVPGAFAPAHVTINSGDTITWTNNTNGQHQVVSDDGNFASPDLEAGQSHPFVFKTAGQVVVHDALRPRIH